MALAANVRQYRPPKRIQQMEADLADLAQVWESTRFAGPWGWSIATKQRYKQMGVAEELLPSDEWLEEVRRLSSREFACGYIKDLLAEMKDERLLGSEMKWIDNLNCQLSTINCQLSTVNCQLIFKSPWSSSGRGVFVAEIERKENQLSTADSQLSTVNCQLSTVNRLQGFLSSQGGFVVDKFYADKVLDFAMEFYVNDDKRVDFLGWSVFHAGENGAYGYNYVESQEKLIGRIDVDASLLQRLINYHKAHLSTLNSQLSTLNYHGPIGIDMLKTADGHIHPCLEINFRMNMGILALLLEEQYGAGCTIQLTPRRPDGFEALVERGKLMIAYRRR